MTLWQNINQQTVMTKINIVIIVEHMIGERSVRLLYSKKMV